MNRYHISGCVIVCMVVGMLGMNRDLCADTTTPSTKEETAPTKLDMLTTLNSPEYGSQMLEMEKEFLSRVQTRKSELHSGEYILRYQFPGKPPKEHTVRLKMYGDIHISFLTYVNTKVRKNGMGNFWSKNNAVSWVLCLPDEGYPDLFDFVGIIDGPVIWGHVYRINWEGEGGWHDIVLNIGVFEIRPKPATPKPETPESKAVTPEEAKPEEAIPEKAIPEKTEAKTPEPEAPVKP